MAIASLAGATGYAQFSAPPRAAQYQGYGYDGNRGYNDNLAYRQGIRDGRSDAQRNRRMDMDARRWNNAQDRSDYQAGYQRGYTGERVRRDARHSLYSSNGSSRMVRDPAIMLLFL